jgi:hypothetical protein
LSNSNASGLSFVHKGEFLPSLKRLSHVEEIGADFDGDVFVLVRGIEDFRRIEAVRAVFSFTSFP